MLEYLIYILVFVIGSCIGSFLNVCIWRIPKNISIVKPPSFCPQCQSPIKWFDNIPIASYILLRGRCRYCGKNIPLRYPIVEILTAVVFLIFYIKFSFSFDFFKYSFFFSLLILASFIDIDYHAIPVYVCVVGLMVGLFFVFLQPTFKYILSKSRDSFLLLNEYIAGSYLYLKNLIIGFGFTYLFKFFGDIAVDIYLSLRGKDSIEGERESLGLGDVDFMGLLAVFMGWKLAILTFFVAPFIGVVYSIYAVIFKKSHLIPYLPYLSLGAFVSFFWGKELLLFFNFF